MLQTTNFKLRRGCGLFPALSPQHAADGRKKIEIRATGTFDLAISHRQLINK